MNNINTELLKKTWDANGIEPPVLKETFEEEMARVKNEYIKDEAAADGE